MAIFTRTEALIEMSYYCMCILAGGYIAMEVTQCLSGIMRGAGDTAAPMWISMLTAIILRIPLAYGLVFLSRSPENPQGICYMMQVSLLVTWVIGSLITFIVYRLGRWKDKAIVTVKD